MPTSTILASSSEVPVTSRAWASFPLSYVRTSSNQYQSSVAFRLKSRRMRRARSLAMRLARSSPANLPRYAFMPIKARADARG